MEGVSINMYKGARWYWRRRTYEKLSGSSRRPRVSSDPTRKTRSWRIRVARPKLGFLRRAVSAPRRVLVWLRDAYVRLMMGFANSRVCSAGYGGAVGFGVGNNMRGPLKEYDEKMIVEIYKSIVMAQGHLVKRDVGDQMGSQLASVTRR